MTRPLFYILRRFDILAVVAYEGLRVTVICLTGDEGGRVFSISHDKVRLFCRAGTWDITGDEARVEAHRALLDK